MMQAAHGAHAAGHSHHADRGGGGFNNNAGRLMALTAPPQNNRQPVAPHPPGWSASLSAEDAGLRSAAGIFRRQRDLQAALIDGLALLLPTHWEPLGLTPDMTAPARWCLVSSRQPPPIPSSCSSSLYQLRPSQWTRSTRAASYGTSLQTRWRVVSVGRTDNTPPSVLL